MEKEKKGRAIALLPIGVFLIIFLGAGIVFKDFYAMPAIVAFLIALFVAFLQNKELSFNKKIEVIAKGVGEENIITMSLIFLCAGGFSGAVTAAGGVDSTVNLGLSLIPAHFAVAGLFLIGCFISVSMGTSMGTIAALAPIAVGISEKTGFALSICIGAVVCGAMFGDNLSMISDTTIAAVKTQGCEMKDKFKAKLFHRSSGSDYYSINLLVCNKKYEFPFGGKLKLQPLGSSSVYGCSYWSTYRNQCICCFDQRNCDLPDRRCKYGTYCTF